MNFYDFLYVLLGSFPTGHVASITKLIFALLRLGHTDTDLDIKELFFMAVQVKSFSAPFEYNFCVIKTRNDFSSLIARLRIDVLVSVDGIIYDVLSNLCNRRVINKHLC